MQNIVILCMVITAVNCSTHWVVTEEGKVQERLESPFAINHPHDLVAFMKQEENYEKLQKMKETLIKEKNSIEENEDKDFELENRHYRQDNDCRLAGKRLADFDLYMSSLLPLENKHIVVSDYIDTKTVGVDVPLHEPDCVSLCPIPESANLYDHLEGMINRKTLRYLPETGLRATLNYMSSEKEFANAVADALKKNSSSWVAYNLATFYWRMKGEPAQALECTRRALHFSPTEYRDVALSNLANILHRSHYSLNASAVMLEALEISEHVNVNHFTLACIYASLHQYNESIAYFAKTIEAQPEFEAAKSRLHAVKCQHKLQMKLEAQHESLQRTLHELESYQEKHKKYMEMYLNIEKMQLSRQDQINMHFLLMQYLIKHGMFDHKLCKFQSGEAGPVVFCDLPKPSGDFSDTLLSDSAEKGHSKENASGAETYDEASEPDYNLWTDPGFSDLAAQTLV